MRALSRPGVEVSGLEPPASSLRTMRSSQLSYTPGGNARHYSRASRPPTWLEWSDRFGEHASNVRKSRIK